MLFKLNVNKRPTYICIFLFSWSTIYQVSVSIYLSVSWFIFLSLYYYIMEYYDLKNKIIVLGVFCSFVFKKRFRKFPVISKADRMSELVMNCGV